MNLTVKTLGEGDFFRYRKYYVMKCRCYCYYIYCELIHLIVSLCESPELNLANITVCVTTCPHSLLVLLLLSLLRIVNVLQTPPLLITTSSGVKTLGLLQPRTRTIPSVTQESGSFMTQHLKHWV